ncbi:MAG: primase C-terminal domain-containing protein [Bacteroidetes bacterium]|nr:primase C-terminal domain-containing protein [Bacteroidota bacterium]
MRKVTIFIRFIKIREHATLEEVLMRIKLCTYGKLIRELRDYVKAGDLKRANEIKRSLLAFTPSATFEGGRKLENMLKYTGIIVLDIDKLTDEDLLRIKAIINQCEYTLACFVSPGGHGLKVLVCVGSQPSEHQFAFNCLKEHYEALTGVSIDPSGKDITRLCFFSMDDALYYNPSATIYYPGSNQETMKPVIEPTPPVLNGSMAVNLATGEVVSGPSLKSNSGNPPASITDSYKRCIAAVERELTFIEGQRNAFVFNLALQMRRAGFAEGTTTVMLLSDYNFDQQEVTNCVKSAYSYNWTDEAKGKKKSSSTASKPVDQAVDQSVEEKDTPVGDETEPLPLEPDKKRRSKNRTKYNLEEVENLLRKWYHTRYNEVTGVVEWRKSGSKDKYERLIDYDENSMFRKLHLAGQEIPLNTLHALITSSFSRAYNPFIDFFKRAKTWDGTTDYIGQLSATVKTTDDAHWALCFKKWFVAYIASMFCDEVINHTVIVFVGAQGVGKTTWMKQLVPLALMDYLGTAALQTEGKDTSIQLTECCLIILDELENLNRRDLSSFKELITRPAIRIRRPYGRNTDNLPHRASFISAVNHALVLTDTSGSRRYLCFTVEDINYQHNIDINSAFAQAYTLFKNGFQYWFDQDEIKELTLKNEDFMAKSVEEELVETWIRPVTRQEWDTRHQFMNSQNIQLLTTTEIASKLMEKAKFNLTDSTIVKIGKILKKQGFERIRKGNNYSYMLRFLDTSVVEKNSRTLEEVEAEKAEAVANEQVVRFEEDLFAANNTDNLPF